MNVVEAYDDCMSALATRSSALYVARIAGASYTVNFLSVEIW